MKTLRDTANLILRRPPAEGLVGETVTARPLGWDEELTAAEVLDHDPYDGPTDPVTGILEVVDVPGDDATGPYSLYVVGGIVVDPTTIRKAKGDIVEVTTNAPPSQKASAAALYELSDEYTRAEARDIARAVLAGYNNDKSSAAVSKVLQKQLGLPAAQADVVATTELTRVAAADQLSDAGKAAEAQGRRGKVRFISKDRSCPLCQALHGRVYTLEKAQNVIPVHPHCTCRWQSLGGPTKNVFCPTGEGGGIDPTCGKGGRVSNPPNPIPRVDRETETRMEMALRKFAGDDTIREFIKFSQTEENVPISLLSSPQTVKNVKSVGYFKEDPKRIDDTLPLPLVIQFGNRMILRDGNSRTAAAQELGRDSIKARVVYLPEGV